MEKVALDQNFRESRIILLMSQILIMSQTLHWQGPINEQKFWDAICVPQSLICQIFMFSIGYSGQGLTAAIHLS